MDLVSRPDKQVFFTTPAQWLRKKTNKITFEPSAGIFLSESSYFGLNWLIMWCVAYVATEGFRDSAECIDCKSYFNIKDSKGAPIKSQTWHDGVRLGVQWIAAHAKIPAVSSLPSNKILFEGTKDAIKNPAGIVTISDLDKIYGAGFGAQVEAYYNEIEAFARGDEFENPPTDGDTLPTPEPTRPPPVIIVEPPKEEPGAPQPAWKRWLKWILGLLSSSFVIWILGFWVPGSWINIVKMAVDVLKKLFGVE